MPFRTHPVIVAHVVAGAAGLALGSVTLLSPRGGPAHRLFGKAFALFAGVTLACAAAAILLFRTQSWIYAATLSGVYQYAGSLRALALKDRGPGIVDGLAALAVLFACAALFRVYAEHGDASATVGFATVAWVAAIAVWDLCRPLFARTWITRLRPLDHGLKMTGVYFAMAAAGSGNLLRALQPWSQIAPTLLGVAVIAALAARRLNRTPGPRAV